MSKKQLGRKILSVLCAVSLLAPVWAPVYAQDGENGLSTIGASNEGDTELPSCTCTTRCTEGNVDPDCPVCSVQGTDLSACAGSAARPATLDLSALRTSRATLWDGQSDLNGGSYEIPGAVEISGDISLSNRTIVTVPAGASLTVAGTLNIQTGSQIMGTLTIDGGTLNVNSGSVSEILGGGVSITLENYS